MSSLLKITLLELSMVMIITHAAMGGAILGCYCDIMAHEGARTQRENIEVDKASEIDEVNQMDDDKTLRRQAGKGRYKASCSTDSDCKDAYACVRQQKGKKTWYKSGM